MDYPETSFVASYEPAGNDRVKLRNGRFMDVKNGCYLDPGTVVTIEGKKIAYVGPDEAPHALKPDFTIDLKGKKVLPGLFNTHCHVTAMAPSLMPEIKDIKLFKANRKKQLEKNMAECLIHGITHIRDAFTEDLRRVRTLSDRISRGEIPGPRIIRSVVVGPPGGYLTEKPGLIMRLMKKALGAVPVDRDLEYCGVVEFPVDATPQQVRDAVDRAIDERGAEMIKTGEQKENLTNFKPDSTIMRTDQLKAIANQAAKRGLKSHIHQVSVDSFRRAVEAGFSSLAHLPRDGVITKNDVEAFLACGCYSDPTLSVPYDVSFKIKGESSYEDPYLNKLSEYRRLVHARLVDEFWIPELRKGAMAHFERADSDRMKIFNLFPMTKVFKYYAPAAAFGPLNLRLLFEMGAKLTTSNDGGIPPCTPAMMQHEIDLIDLFLNRTTGERIFSGADAIKMATINSAECLGLEDSFGSIETGKVADLVILDGDPLEDCHAVGSRAAALFLYGRLTINNCGLAPVKQLSP